MTTIRNNLLSQISDLTNQISNGVYPVSRPDVSVLDLRKLKELRQLGG